VDFNLNPRNESYRKRIRDFVEQELLPLEANPAAYDEHENIAPEYLEQMRAKARQQDLWCLQIPEHLGGQGLDISGMAACMLAAGELERAEKLLNAIPVDERKDPEIASVFKRLEMAKEVAELGDPVELEARLASNPADHEARIKFAKILNAKGHRDAAADELFTIMRKDPKWEDEAARKMLLEFFEAWGPMDPATLAARRKLSSLLFS